MLSGVERAFAKATAPQASPRKALSGHGASPSKVNRVFSAGLLLRIAFQPGGRQPAADLGFSGRAAE